MQNIPEQIKVCGDVLSVSCVSATLMQVLPPMAALLTVLWTIVRLYETKTVQKILGKERTARTRADDE